MSQHDTLTRALQEIADWNSHTTEFAVDYGSNGVRDFYRGIARAALSATQPAQAKQSDAASEVFTALADHCPVDNGWFNGRAAQGEPVRHIGDSKFESWYQAHPKANGGDKQLARDAYAAGMFDPVAQGAGEVVAWLHQCRKKQELKALSFSKEEPGLSSMGYKPRPLTYADTQPAAGADVQLLDAMERHRIAVVPEFEGTWDASVYGEEGEPQFIGSGDTPRDAIRAAIAASGRQE